MKSLVAFLPRYIGSPVEDRTGLASQYNFRLTRVDIHADAPNEWGWGALGLELKPVKIRTNALVIDHIERPSPN